MISFFKECFFGDKAFTLYAHHQITQKAFCVSISSEFQEFRRFRGIFKRPEVYYGVMTLQGRFSPHINAEGKPDSVDEFEVMLRTHKDVEAVYAKLEQWREVLELEGRGGEIDSLVQDTLGRLAECVYA